MNRWKVPVTWEMCGFVEIEAEFLSDAMEIARDDDGVFPLPSDGNYVDGSWALTSDDEDFVKLYQSQSMHKNKYMLEVQDESETQF